MKQHLLHVIIAYAVSHTLANATDLTYENAATAATTLIQEAQQEEAAFCIFLEAGKLETPKSMENDARYKKLNSLAPSSAGILGATIAYGIGGYENPEAKATEEAYSEFRSLLSQNLDLSSQYINIDEQYGTSRTAEMRSLAYICTGEETLGSTYGNIFRERKAAEEAAEKETRIRNIETLLQLHGREQVMPYVLEMRGLLPKDYLNQQWPEVIA